MTIMFMIQIWNAKDKQEITMNETKILVTRWKSEGNSDLILKGNKLETFECAHEHAGEEEILHGTEEYMNEQEFLDMPEWEG